MIRSMSIAPRICPHGVSLYACPACDEDRYWQHVADNLAALDTETAESLRAEFETRLRLGCLALEELEVS